MPTLQELTQNKDFMTAPPQIQRIVIDRSLADDPKYQAASPEIRELVQTRFIDSLSDVPGAPAIRQDFPVRKAIAQGVQTTAEGLGSGFGAAAGTASPVPGGGFIGGTIGFGIGKQVGKITKELLGLRQTPPIGQQFAESAQDLLEGAVLEGAGLTGAKVITRGLSGNILKAIPFLSKKATKTSRRALQRNQAAEELGFKLTAADATQSRPLALLVESTLDKIPWSTARIREFRLSNLRNLVKQRETLINKQGPAEAIEKLGAMTQNEIDSFINKFKGVKITKQNQLRDTILSKMGSSETFQELSERTVKFAGEKSRLRGDIGKKLYKKIGEAVPEGATASINNYQKKAKMLLEGFKNRPPEFQAKHSGIIKFLEEAGSGQTDDVAEFLGRPGVDPDPSVRLQLESQPRVQPGKRFKWQTLQDVRSDLNSFIRAEDTAVRAGKPGIKGLGTPEGGVYKQLVTALDEDMAQFANETGGNVLKRYRKATNYWKAFKKTMKSGVVKKMLKENPDRLTGEIIKQGAEGSASEIIAAKIAIGTKNFNNTIKKAFTNKLLRSTLDENFVPAQLQKDLAKYSDETLKQVYNPTELKQLKELAATSFDKLDKKIINNPFFKAMSNNPAKIAELLLVKGPTGNVDLIKKAVDKKTFGGIKRAVLEKIMEINKHELISPQKFTTNLHKFREPLKRLLSKEDFNDLTKLGDVSQLLGSAEDLAGNPSGTTQTLISYGIGVGLLTNPVTGLKIAVTSRGLTELYLSKIGRKYLSTGLRMPSHAKEAASLFTKILGIVGLENLRDTEQPGEGSAPPSPTLPEEDSEFVSGATSAVQF